MYEIIGGKPTNRLVTVDEPSTTSNYTYYANGRLKSDIQHDIDLIIWNAYGKIAEVQRTANSDLVFKYNAAGQRVLKLEKAGTNQASWKYTYYIKDINGNIMSMYRKSYTNQYTYYIKGINGNPQHNFEYFENITQTDVPLYGADRLGSAILNKQITSFKFSSTFNNDGTFVNPTIIPTMSIASFTLNNALGKKQYELKNHLGNVILTVSDFKYGIDNNADNFVDTYFADIRTAQTYYPFGMIKQDGNNNINISGYVFGFQGQEKDDEIFNSTGTSYTAEFWQYDPRLGRRWNVDPVPNASISPYAAFNNNPIIFTDPDGRFPNIGAFLKKMGNKLGNLWRKITGKRQKGPRRPNPNKKNRTKPKGNPNTKSKIIAKAKIGKRKGTDVVTESRTGTRTASVNPKSKAYKYAKKKNRLSNTTNWNYQETWLGSANREDYSWKDKRKEIKIDLNNDIKGDDAGDNGQYWGKWPNNWPLVDNNNNVITSFDSDRGIYVFFNTGNEVLFDENDNIIDDKGNILFESPKGKTLDGDNSEYLRKD